MANAYSPSYTTLVSEIQDICENTNDEFVANIPRFIQRAADQVQRDLGLELWNAYSDTTLTTTGILARDADWLIVRSLYLTLQGKFIEKRHIDYVRLYRGIGRPKVWCEDEQATIIIGPTPNSSYPVKVQYYERLAALSVSNETNWLTANAGDLLLLQALINAQSYLVSPERVQEFSGMYQAVLQGSVTELRDSERQRYTPVRSAPRPVLQPGASA